MNNDQTPDPEDTQPEDFSENSGRNGTASAGGNVREAIEDLSRSLRNVVTTGSREARRAFEDAIPKTKDDLAKGIHDIAYAVAYTVAFGNVLTREITPDNLKDGFREGARSGKSAAERVLRQRREKAEREARETPPSESAPETLWT